MRLTIEDIKHEVVPIGELKPHPANYRNGDLENLAESIGYHGVYRSIVVSKDGFILCGNHTYMAALEKGIGEMAIDRVPFMYDDPQSLKIMAEDNRANDLAKNDDGLLASLLQSLPDLEGTGYHQESLDEILGRSLDPLGSGNTDPDQAPAPPVEAHSKLGDVWLLGPHRIMCGDSTKDEDVLKLMAGERSPLMPTDPPYLVDYDGGNHAQAWSKAKVPADKKWDDSIDHAQAGSFFEGFIAVARRSALTERPAVYQWHAIARPCLVDGSWRNQGLLPHQTIIWVKARSVLGHAHFSYQHEVCLYGWVQGKMPEISRRPPATATTVWHVDQKGETGGIHPTQKPVELITQPIEWHTRKQEVVYEPFSGSGTAIIAAEMTGRRCFAMELSPNFVDVACRRWQEFAGQTPVLESTAEPHQFGEVELNTHPGPARRRKPEAD